MAPQADRAELLARRARLAAALQAHALGSLGAILSRHYRVRGGGAAAALDAALTAQACAADARCDVDLVAPTAVSADSAYVSPFIIATVRLPYPSMMLLCDLAAPTWVRSRGAAECMSRDLGQVARRGRWPSRRRCTRWRRQPARWAGRTWCASRRRRMATAWRCPRCRPTAPSARGSWPPRCRRARPPHHSAICGGSPASYSHACPPGAPSQLRRGRMAAVRPPLQRAGPRPAGTERLTPGALSPAHRPSRRRPARGRAAGRPRARCCCAPGCTRCWTWTCATARRG